MRESTIEHYLVKIVRTKLHGECLKFTSPGRRHVNDRLCILPKGEIWFVETKAPAKKPRPGQVRFHARLKELGAATVVLDTKEKIDAWAFSESEELWRKIL